MEMMLAVILGGLFGFALNRVGATNPQNIINMLRLTDLHLMKVILFAIGLSSSVLFLGLAIGVIDAGHLSVKSSYVGVIVGGGLLGLGFAIAGYCPGTGLVAAATGRRDALAFVAGGLLGAWAFALAYAAIKDTVLMQSIAGGKVTLADTGNEKFAYLLDFAPGTVIGLVLGIAIMLIAWKLPNNLR